MLILNTTIIRKRGFLLLRIYGELAQKCAQFVPKDFKEVGKLTYKLDGLFSEREMMVILNNFIDACRKEIENSRSDEKSDKEIGFSRSITLNQTNIDTQ